MIQKKNTFTNFILNFFAIILGNTIYCLGVVMFLIPNGIITGGTTGLSLCVKHFAGVPISITTLIFNTIMFILGALILGKAFALTTLVSTFYYPLILEVVQKIPGISSITEDKMLSVLCAGVMIGFGIGIVIHAGASTGGMDIPPLLLKKFFGIPVSASLYAFDFLILVLQMSFSNKEEIIYGILLVFIYTFVLDKILTLGLTSTQVKIVSQKYEEINALIHSEIDRGTTLLHGETGFMHYEYPVILTVISNRELIRLNKLVTDIDPAAFIIINKVSEVRGKGFSLPKVSRSV